MSTSTRFLILMIFIFCASALHAQREEHYTMFMLNKLTYNPAYAGIESPFTVDATARRQWIGFEGAPATEKISTDFSLLNNHVGMGISLLHNQIGVSNKFCVATSYAYRIQVADGYFSAGLSASLRYMTADYLDKRLKASTEISLDASVPVEVEKSFAPDFGFGLYYDNKKFYAGLSAPNLLNNRMVRIGEKVQTLDSRRLYLMGGYRFKWTNFEIYPQAVFRYWSSAPFDADVNMMVTFREKLKVGLGYRLGGDADTHYGESVDFMAGLPVSNTLFFGMSYDYPLTRLGQYTAGSLEAILQYRIHESEDGRWVDPRFF